MKAAPLVVGIDARLISGEWGGVESVIQGLASGLSLLDGPERYLFLTYRGGDEWIQPYLGGPAEALFVRATIGSSTQALRRHLKMALPGLARLWGNRPGVPGLDAGPPPSEGTIERAGADVMHFTIQGGFLTKVPSIYHPHDLQHLHLPQFFTPAQVRWRERWYRSLAAQAAMVAVASTWVKDDLERQYRLPRGKVIVVPWAPPTAATRVPDRTSIKSTSVRLGLPDRFVFYPAQTWPHKNHVRLLEALSLLRLEGMQVNLVCTGQTNEFHKEIRSRERELGLTGQLTWLGFVPAEDLEAVYRSSTAVILPTLFEAASAPLWEAFRAGVPAACSDVTSLPEQAGDAALLFDPESVPAIASAIRQLWTDERLRRELVVHGRKRVETLSWDRTARTFRSHYRRIAGRDLSEEDRELLGRPAYL
jgi:glycosyltransferase involved in cell wall biosynthesis